MKIKDIIKRKFWFKIWLIGLPKELVALQILLFEFLETSARRYIEQNVTIFYGKRITYKELW